MSSSYFSEIRALEEAAQPFLFCAAMCLFFILASCIHYGARSSPHPSPHLLSQMPFCRSSFTFCLCVCFFVFYFVCVPILFSTSLSTLPVLLIPLENISCFFTSPLPPFVCVCLVFVSDLHRSAFIMEFLFLVCFAFLCSLDCNQVAQPASVCSELGELLISNREKRINNINKRRLHQPSASSTRPTQKQCQTK